MWLLYYSRRESQHLLWFSARGWWNMQWFGSLEIEQISQLPFFSGAILMDCFTKVLFFFNVNDKRNKCIKKWRDSTNNSNYYKIQNITPKKTWTSIDSKIKVAQDIANIVYYIMILSIEYSGRTRESRAKIHLGGINGRNPNLIRLVLVLVLISGSKLWQLISPCTFLMFNIQEEH